MKRSRSPGTACGAATGCDDAGDDRNAAPQRVVAKGDGPAASMVVVNSPYGEQRGVYGWGHLFEPPRRALVPGYPDIHIGVSSLNAVPGRADRAMKSLLAQYRRKFNCLEHCYPYHKVSDADAWRGWAEMVRDSNANAPTLPCGVASPERFIYTIKANSLLTHIKQLAFDEELEEHVSTFFRERCPLLGPFLGPILLQLPPYFHFSAANLARLCALHARLPRDEVTVFAGTCARPHVTRTPSPDHSTPRRCRSPSGEPGLTRRPLLRIAVEFRHRSWYRDEVFQRLRELGWALVVAQHYADPTFATHVDTGVPFMYVRLHGAIGEHVGDYGPSAMNYWASVVRRFVVEQCAKGVVPEVFFFLNNNTSQVGGVASSVVDATYLAERLAATLPPAPGADWVASLARTPTTQPHPVAHTPANAGQTSRGGSTRRPRQKTTTRTGKEIVLVDQSASSSQETITID